MSTSTEAIRGVLMASNREYQRLRDEHAEYASKLNELACKPRLNDEEQVEEVRLKKLKLRVKDQMELLVAQARTIH